MSVSRNEALCYVNWLPTTRASIRKLSVEVFFTIPLAKLGRIVGQKPWLSMWLLIEEGSRETLLPT